MRPVFIDLETRSPCDLPTRGGWNYAADPHTRLLTVAWRDGEDGRDCVWMPGLDECDAVWKTAHLPEALVFHGPLVPGPLADLRDRPWVAHNAEGFDRHVWEARVGWSPAAWVDTVPLALAVGLPGGLAAIGKRLWGEGKYEAGQKSLKLASRCTKADCDPRNVPVGQQWLIAKYNIQDVRLLAALWPYLAPHADPREDRVLRAHNAINGRGVRIDRDLVRCLVNLAAESKARAVEHIAELTKDDPHPLPTETAVQSRTAVFRWLESVGVKFGTSLRKDIVARWIEAWDTSSGDEREPDAPDDGEAPPPGLARIVKVMQLRLNALRITGGKLTAALESVCGDGRARGLYAYWGAHTGRWSGRRIQLQNLPRPKAGVDTWKLIRHYESTGGLSYGDVAALLPTGQHAYRHLTPDDAAGALLRSILLPDEGKVLATADLSQIEARVLAWLAGDRDLVSVYESGGDPYIRMAEVIQGPKEGWPNPDGVKYSKHPYRQYVGKVPVLACGYGGGPAAVGNYCAMLGFDMEDYGVTPQQVVTAWRKAHPLIAGKYVGDKNGRAVFHGGLWRELDDAAKRAVGGVHAIVGPVVFGSRGPHLVVRLPSGRELYYRDAAIEEVKPMWAKHEDVLIPSVVFTHPRYGRKAAYPGLWAENIVQAISRDVLAHGLVMVEEEGMPVCLHTHDEGGASIDESEWPAFMSAFTTCPTWLPCFPLDAQGGVASRYAKDPEPGRGEETWRNGKRA